MASSSNMEDLIAQLANISAFAETSSVEPTEKASNKLSEFIRFVDSTATARIVNPKIAKHRESLPIFTKKTEFIQAIKQNQILIVIGETGSGKTTQIPQYVVEAGLTISGKVGCTQLRRMAAKAVAERVAKEYGCTVGKEVGYTIRFEDLTDVSTKIQYMTDGILLRECLYDPLLSSFSVVILDESHERTIDTDVLLAVLRHISSKRDDIKLIISSATLDAQKFSTYFFDAPIFQINGRMFPVDIIHVNHYVSEASYINEAALTVRRINEREQKGDILVFLSGEDDIENLSETLEQYSGSSLYPKLQLCPVYSALPWELQALMFEKADIGCRKVVIATNIAETALTVDGIRYVIDAGYVKQKVYDSRKEMDVLKRVRISQAQAIQRAGRAGRVSSGKCFRLYSEDVFNKMTKAPDPEISRSNLTNAVLLLKRMGYNNISEIQFLDKPPQETIEDAISELRLFQAIDARGVITEIGHKMAGFPLEPNLAKMLIISEKLGCSEEILTIVAMVSVPPVFYRRKKLQRQADAAKQKFLSIHGDLVTLMNIFKQWKCMNGDRRWCKDNFLKIKVLEQADQIRDQLEDVMKKRNMKIRSCEFDMIPVLKSICSGFFQNLAKRSSARYRYTTLPKQEHAFIHPGSALFKSHPEWVVYQRLMMTNKPYMREITPIDNAWLVEFTPLSFSEYV